MTAIKYVHVLQVGDYTISPLSSDTRCTGVVVMLLVQLTSPLERYKTAGSTAGLVVLLYRTISSLSLLLSFAGLDDDQCLLLFSCKPLQPTTAATASAISTASSSVVSIAVSKDSC